MFGSWTVYSVGLLSVLCFVVFISMCMCVCVCVVWCGVRQCNVTTSLLVDCCCRQCGVISWHSQLARLLQLFIVHFCLQLFIVHFCLQLFVCMYRTLTPPAVYVLCTCIALMYT